MSFRGRNTSRFRRSGSHDKLFRGRGRSDDRFRGRDFERQYEVSDRGGRRRGFSKHSAGRNLRSPRSHQFRGGFLYRNNRGRDFGRYFKERRHRRFSPQRSHSPLEWEEEPIHLSDDGHEELIHRRRRFQSPVEWFDDCDDNELLDGDTRHSNGRPISPLIIHRRFVRGDCEDEDARERSLERREWSPLSDQSRRLGRNYFDGFQERMSNERSRSPLSMRSFRDEIQGSFGRPRSQLSVYSIRRRSRSLERSHSSLLCRRYRRDSSNHSGEIKRRPYSKLSSRSGRSFEKRNLSRSPNRFFGRRSESQFSIRSRSLEKRFKREWSFDRRSNSRLSVQSGSLKSYEMKSGRRELAVRSRSSFISHSKEFKHDNIRLCNRSGSPFKQGGSIERDGFLRDKSLPRCFSPDRRQIDRGRLFKVETQSCKQRYQSQSLEHQKRYHEKRSESSIERFLNDCKKSVEHKQSGRSDTSLRTFQGLDHIVIERGKSFERNLLPDEVMFKNDKLSSSKDVLKCKEKSKEKRSVLSHSSKLQLSKQKSPENINRLSPISSKSSNVGKTEVSQHSDVTKEDNSKLPPHSNLKIDNTSNITGRDKCIEKEDNLNSIDIPNNEGNLNLSPISKSSIVEKIELKERKDFENRLSPISSQSGSIGEEDITKRGNKFVGQDDLNLSPISQCNSFDKYKFSEKSLNLSPISQVECFDDEKTNNMLLTRKHKMSNSNDSMQEFLAELERDEIGRDEESCPPKQVMLLNDSSKFVSDKVFGGQKKLNTPEKNNDIQSDSLKQYSTNKKNESFERDYFKIANNGDKLRGYNQKLNTFNSKIKQYYDKPCDQTNFTPRMEQLTHSQTSSCSNEPYNTQNQHFTISQPTKGSNINYPLRHTGNTSSHCTPQMQQFGPNLQFTMMGSVYDQSPRQISEISKSNSLNNPNSSDQLLRIPHLSFQEKPYHNASNVYPRTGNLSSPFSNSSQTISEINEVNHMQEKNRQMLFQQVCNRPFELKDNAYDSQILGSTLYQNIQYRQSSEVPCFLTPPHNFGVSIQTPNSSSIRTENNTPLFPQEVNRFVPNSKMPHNFQMGVLQPQITPTEFQAPQWQRNPEPNLHLTNLTGDNFSNSTTLSVCPNPIWPNPTQSYFAEPVGQIQSYQNTEKLEQNRSNLKFVNISETVPARFGVKSLQTKNEVQGSFSSGNVQPMKSFNDNQSSCNVPNQKNPQTTQFMTATAPAPVNIKKHLAPIFGRNYFPIMFPQAKEVITISDDEDVNIRKEAQCEDQNPIAKHNMKIVENLVPSSVFVDKYRESPPSPEDLKQMFETFVIYFGVRNNSQLEKDPFCVIQESFSRSQGFGTLHVEENEEYHDFLPVPKQACILRWNGVLLSKATCYSKEEARHKASITLINTLAHVCYTVQAKYSYYCGGKLPKFMMTKPEQPGLYKVVERDEIMNAVTSTLKTLKESNYFTGKGVDATHVRVVLGFIDDFFRDKNTFCELIFGSQSQSDYTIGELKTISTHVNQLSWLDWRSIGGFGRGMYTAVCRKKTPQELYSFLRNTGENVRYRLIPPQDPWIDLLQPNCQYNPNIKKF